MGSLRMFLSYRASNKVTIKNKYLVPNAFDLFKMLFRASLFEMLFSASYFTKMDMREGY